MSAGSFARPLAVVLSLFGVLVILSSAAYPRGVVVSDQILCQGFPEPENAAAFIQAQRDQDVEKSSLVTSPLFRAELERRDRADRMAAPMGSGSRLPRC